MIRRRRGRKSGIDDLQEFQAINITPFTDVLLVLLIIFLIAGSSLTRSGVGIDRLGTRTASEGAAAVEPDRVPSLRVDSVGQIWLWRHGRLEEKATIDSLDPTLEWELSAQPETRMQFVVEAYDRLLKAGFTKLTLSEP